MEAPTPKLLTPLERATHGTCPTCSAPPGIRCKGKAAHVSRLERAPRKVVSCVHGCASYVNKGFVRELCTCGALALSRSMADETGGL